MANRARTSPVGSDRRHHRSTGGTRIDRPNALSRSLGEGLFELRFTLGPTARRITYRFTTDGRIVLLTTFRKQRNNERAEIARAHKAAEDCARTNP